MIFMPRPRTSKKAVSPGTEACGVRIAALRKEKGFTQTDLAEQIGVGQVAVSDYEVGKCYPSADVLTKLSALLGVSTDELLGLQEGHGNTEETKSISGRILRRLKTLATLPEHDQKSVLRMIDALAAATPKSRRVAV